MANRLQTVDIETDVLIIGGGIAGCMAAIKAGESGLKVTIAEKANTKRSGEAGTGIDHMWAYVPEIFEPMGWSIDDLIEDHTLFYTHGFTNRDLLHLIVRTSYDRILDLERFGLKIRYEDSRQPEKFRLVYQAHSLPNTFNIDGAKLKPILTKECKRRGVKIINRVMVNELLVNDGNVTGAMGLGTRSGEIYFFRTGAVVLTAGGSTRLCRNLSGVDFNWHTPPSLTGDGKSMAFRAGAEMVNMEFMGGRAINIGGNEPASGFPRNTFQPAGAIVDWKGENIIPKTSFADWERLQKGRIDTSKERELMRANRLRSPVLEPLGERIKKGEGPFYLDCTGGTEEEIKYIEWSLSHEGKCWLYLHHLREQGYDLRKDVLELVPNGQRGVNARGGGGLFVDNNLESNLKGLFAAGTEVGQIIRSASTGAAALGWHAGEKAAERAASLKNKPDLEKEKVEEYRESCEAILNAKDGEHWKDMEIAIQNLVDHYRGEIVYEPLLKRGLERLEGYRRAGSFKANNIHELTRCLEVQSIMDMAEMVLVSSIERKETRRKPFGFVRADYPDQDDKAFRGFNVFKKEKDKYEFRQVPI